MLRSETWRIWLPVALLPLANILTAVIQLCPSTTNSTSSLASMLTAVIQLCPPTINSTSPLASILTAVIIHTSVLTSYTVSSTLVSFLPSAVIWILGAIAEELFYRFFLLRTVFLRKISPVPAILLTSVFFAGMHIFNLRTGQPVDVTLVQVFEAFCLSIWAGAVTWKSTWLIPLLAHVLTNATAGAGSEVMCLWVSLLVSVVVLVDGLLLMKEERR